MFEELGLNVARQADNGANPRPDNRSGWLEGETPRTPVDELIDSPGRGQLLGPVDAAALPQEDLRAAAPRRRARTACPERRSQVEPEAATDAMSRDRGAAGELKRAAASTAGCAGVGPAGAARAARRQARCCCCARTTTSAWPTTRACARRPPRRRCATASAPGASRLVSGNMTIHRRLEERLADVQGQPRRACCSARATSPTPASCPALAREGDVVFSDALNHAVDHRRLPALAGRDVRLRPLRHRPPRVGPAPGRGPRRADRHRRRVLDGRRRRAAAPRSSSWRSATTRA